MSRIIYMNKVKAMTLIEVLITIVVFTSGILVILNIITGSLSLGRRSRNRTNATMLAKEGMEMMYNIRDTNLDKAQVWSCIPIVGNECAYNITVGDGTYTFTVEATGAINIKTTSITSAQLDQARLYITTGVNDSIIYTHAVTDQPSQFYRIITISNVAGAIGNSATINNNIKKISSKVRYPQLGGTGEVVIDSFIGLTRQ